MLKLRVIIMFIIVVNITDLDPDEHLGEGPRTILVARDHFQTLLMT